MSYSLEYYKYGTVCPSFMVGYPAVYFIFWPEEPEYTIIMTMFCITYW